MLPFCVLVAQVVAATSKPTAPFDHSLQPEVVAQPSLLASTSDSQPCPYVHGCSAEALDALGAGSLPTVVHTAVAVDSQSREGPRNSSTKCYNDCFGRGTCDRGVCQCNEGNHGGPAFSGWDCGSTPPAAEDTGFVYVYDVDPEAGLTNYLEDGEGLYGGDSNYQAEIIFLERLMKDFSVRTLSPEKAKLFYTPTLAYYYTNNVCPGPQCLDMPAMRRAARYWGASPAAPHGEDHVYFFTNDKGACGMPQGPVYITHWGLTSSWSCMGREADEVCQLRHTDAMGTADKLRDAHRRHHSFTELFTQLEATGHLDIRNDVYTDRYPLRCKPWCSHACSQLDGDAASECGGCAPSAQGCHPAAPDFPVPIDARAAAAPARINLTAVHRTDLNTTHTTAAIPLADLPESWEDGLCADKRSIISTPFGTSAPSPADALAIRQVADRHEKNQSWMWELSFAGGIGGPGGSDDAPSSMAMLDGLCAGGGCYSQGVRQEVWVRFQDAPRFNLNSGAASDTSVYGDSRFCLAPSGDGYGLRLHKAVLIGGCVPVVIQPHVRQSFDELLPYEDFSLTVPREHLKRLPEILRAVTPRRHAQMRQAMLRVQHAFTFAQSEYGGDAYRYLVDSLRLRAGLDPLTAKAVHKIGAAAEGVVE